VAIISEVVLTANRSTDSDKTKIVHDNTKAYNTCTAPQAAYRSCSGAVQCHRQSGRTA